MRGAAVLLVLLVLAGCGDRSMLGADLDRKLTEIDRAVGRGEQEVACARLAEVLPPLAKWAEQARGERATVGLQLLEQLTSLSATCAIPGGNLTASWPPLYQELRRISTYKTSWLTVFTYVSMLVVGIAVYLFLRRKKRA